MSLVLIADHGRRSTPITAIAGTLIASKSDQTPNAGRAEPANKLDLVFDAAIWRNSDVLRWLAWDGADAAAEFTVTDADHSRVIYALTGIALRSMTTTAQGGTSQASLIVGANHLKVGGIALN